MESGQQPVLSGTPFVDSVCALQFGDISDEITSSNFTFLLSDSPVLLIGD